MGLHQSGEQATDSEQICEVLTLLAFILEARGSNLIRYNDFIRFSSLITPKLKRSLLP
jgi:hypothetical protein